MRNIVMFADPHGDWRVFRNLYQNNQEYFDNFDDNIVIVLGDIGANFFFNHRDKEFKEKISKFPFTYFFIRGNHEERPSIIRQDKPDEWQGEIFFDGIVHVEKQYPKIKYAADIPCIYNIEGYHTLTLPGAYSVDKDVRLARGWSWFENEQMSAEEMGYGWDCCEKYDYELDLILSHTCPYCYMPTDLFLPQVDQNLVDKSMERFFGALEYKVNYKLWAWGHYHRTRVYQKVDGGKQPLMLYNDQALDLSNFIKTGELKFLDVNRRND